ncbi:MAG: hypothetical protein KDI27_00340 [Gammaproteobacteria bacterium]|nr:hypothetical protein [Gammaproteobacteria bacterium]MCB1849678.1 hypothetical protein [Gammaproteobacteria bacterium]MCP5418549.1 hypothetical protein [Chromatiaceae bacterium]
MPLHFSEKPGRRERHLLRKQNNPLFPQSQRQISSGALEQAQRLDHEELVEFITQFRKLILEVAELQPNAESGLILSLKERLDKCYEQSAGLADDQRETQQAIVKLQQLIMAAVRKGAGDDPIALQELVQEERARSAHFELLAFPLVADLLAPDSPVGANELAATLLSVPQKEFDAALSLFDEDQRVLLQRDVEALLSELPGTADTLHPRLAQLQPR